MGTLVRSIVAAGVVVLTAQWSKADWERMGGPEGGPIFNLTAIGDTVVASTFSGVYCSHDGGANWKLADSGFLRHNVTVLTACGKDLFAGTTGDGVFHSATAGKSWTAVNAGLTDKNISALTADGSALFAGTYSESIFRSTDNGKNWKVASTGLPKPNKSISSIVVSGQNFFAGIHYDGVYRSTDNGGNWTPVNTGLNDQDINDLAVNGSILFTATRSGGVYRSTDNGGNWIPANTGLQCPYTIDLAVCGSILFVSTVWGDIYRSTDNGESWSTVNNGIKDYYATYLTASGSNLFAGTGNSGVFRSTDSGANWTQINTGLYGHIANTVTTDGTNLFAGTYGGVFISSTNGAKWIPKNSGLKNQSVFSFLVNGLDLFTGTDKGVYLSTNQGDAWTKQALSTYDPVYSLAAIGKNLLASTTGSDIMPPGPGNYSDIYLSIDNGKNWKNVKPILAGRCSAFAVCGNKVFIESSKNIYLSADSGKTWTKSDSLDMPIYCFAVKNNIIFGGTVSPGYIRISTNGGATWETANSGLPDSAKPVTSLAVCGNTIFAGTNSAGVFYSTTNGQLWKPYKTGLPLTASIGCLTIHGDYLFAVADRSSYWRCLLPGASVENPGIAHKNRFSFKATAPTRTNPTLSVAFALSRKERVTIKLFDASGHEVATLADKPFSSGAHRVLWNSRTVASGFYIIKLRAKSGTIAKNIALTR